MTFTMPSFPIIDIPSPIPKDLISNALNAYYTTKYQFPQAAEDLRKSQILNQFLPRREEATVSGLEQANLWNPRLWQSQLDTAAIKREIDRFKLEHRGYMGDATAKQLQFLIDIGAINPNTLRGAQGAMPSPGAEGNLPQPTGYTIDRSGRTVPEPIPTYSTTFGKGNNLISDALRNAPETARMPETNLPTPELTYMTPPALGKIGAGLGVGNVSDQVSQMLSPQGEQPQPQVITGNAAAPFQTGNPLVNAILNKPYAETAYKNKMLDNYNWSHMTADSKNNYYLPMGWAMGIDPLEMQKYVNRDLTVKDIAKLKGLDPNNLPPPYYPPTTATKTRIQQVNQVGAELNYLASAVSALTSPYADTLFGVSGQKLIDQFSSDPESQRRLGRYIAATSVQTGLANGRVLLEGGKPGVQVMKMVKDSSMAGLDQHKLFKLSKIAYLEGQKTINELLEKGAKIRTTFGMSPFEKTEEFKKTTSAKNSKPISKMTTNELLEERKKLSGAS